MSTWKIATKIAAAAALSIGALGAANNPGAGAAPVQTNANVTACFVTSSGTPAANATMTLYKIGYGLYRTGRTNSAGCGTFRDVARGGTYEMYSSLQIGTACLAGGIWYSNARTNRGQIGTASQTYNFGTFGPYFEGWGC